MTASDATGITADLAALLVERVAEVERTQRAEDVDGFLALFDPAATWVTGGGLRLVGLAEIAAFTRRSLPGAFADGGTVAYETQLLRRLADDVVMTGVIQTYADRDGIVTARGLPTYVWSHDRAGWRIVLGQNTAVPG